MQFHDTLTLDAPKRTKDGFLATRAKAARAGIYDYSALEVGGLDRGFKAGDVVKVYRPAEEVFAADSVASFLAKPVTNDHPSVPVTADNWKQHARGVNMGALRDGEYLAFDLVIMDAALIADIDAGKRELSNGYSCVLDWTAGTSPDGQAYDAVQRQIRGNHIAVVDKGRAGPDCKIKDANENKDSNGGKPFAACDANPLAISGLSTGEIKMKITLDGLTVTLTDAAEVQAAFDSKAAIIAAKDAEIATVQTEKAALATDKATLEAENATLKAQIVDLAITPAKLRDAAKAYQAVTDKAKALGVTVSDEMDEAAIQKAVIDAKLGDIAKDWTAEQIAVSFATLAKDVKPEAEKVVHIDAKVTDAASAVELARKARLSRLNNAHRAA